ncbi:MAG: Gfo/Idh/MocA family oxidoreductase [Bacteroidetes bacterium]|nr:Gfo/Idh/MocA family oxidoreductase [Bacteroidota bacterium]
MEKIRWGILSTAKIGLNSVIPALQKGLNSDVNAIASRSLDKANVAAESLGIARAYGSYEELLSDPDVDAIYNPLPNNMHLEWNIKIMEAGKHLLCEKPLGLNAAEVEEMIRVRDKCRVKAGEAFMVKSHPQWIETRERIRRGEIGDPKLVQAAFTYYNVDPSNIRNIPTMGGGGMWDIGCYCVTMSRYVFEEEPLRVVASMDLDPKFGTDRLSSVIMKFPSGQAHFGVSTQLAGFQRMQILGDKGHLEVKIPFNAPIDRPTIIAQDRGNILLDDLTKHEYPTVNQYTLMGDDFSRAIREDREVPVSFEDALKNTKVLAAIFESAGSSAWTDV